MDARSCVGAPGTFLARNRSYGELYTQDLQRFSVESLHQGTCELTETTVLISEGRNLGTPLVPI
jgi:hypothetical protein